jgi:hypothetical protein
MALPQSSDSMANVLRLQGLKNVGGRRKILPGAQFLQDLETVNNDVEGTAQPQDMAVPDLEMGQELTPQSYDVRANEILSPEMEQPEQVDYNRLGRALAQQLPTREGLIGSVPMSNNQGIGSLPNIQASKPVTPQTPPIETTQVDLEEGIPPVTASQQINAEENLIPSEPMDNDAAPPQEKPIEEPVKKEPGTFVEVGSIEKLLKDPNTPPELKSEIERIFDTNLTPALAKQAQDMEKAVDAYIKKLEGVDVALDKREKELLHKVENRDLSASEQIAMALALVAPALIAGLIGGKQGLAYGLAEGGKNLVTNLAGRNKEIKEAQELLPEIALQKSQIGKEKLTTTNQAAELKKKIQESVPNHALRQLFNKDGMILNGKLVLNTGNPLLPLKSSAIRSDKDFQQFREKTMPELADKISTTEQGLHLLDNLKELIDITEEQKKGGVRDYIPFYDVSTKAFKALIPAGRDTFSDENGNEIKISELYETTIEQLSDMYSQAVGAAGSKTAFKTYREHFREMLPNPYTLGSFLKGKTKPGTVISQINSVKDKFEDNIVKKLDSSGVETGPIKELFKGTQINQEQSETARKRQRANQAVNQALGK